MNDLKITISRGFTRKVNLGNYIKTKPFESADFFANYSEELPADTPEKQLKAHSEELYAKAREDVENSVAAFLMDEINALPHKSDKSDKIQKQNNTFVEELIEEFPEAEKHE